MKGKVTFTLRPYFDPRRMEEIINSMRQWENKMIEKHGYYCHTVVDPDKFYSHHTHGLDEETIEGMEIVATAPGCTKPVAYLAEYLLQAEEKLRFQPGTIIIKDDDTIKGYPVIPYCDYYQVLSPFHDMGRQIIGMDKYIREVESNYGV